MGINYMETIAKLFGVELEEEFSIDNWDTRYKFTKDGFLYWSDYCQQWNFSGGIEELLTGKSKLVKIPKPILDEKEKEYLSAVIRPFRDNVLGITKYNYYSGEEFIIIKVNDSPWR